MACPLRQPVACNSSHAGSRATLILRFGWHSLFLGVTRVRERYHSRSRAAVPFTQDMHLIKCASHDLHIHISSDHSRAACAQGQNRPADRARPVGASSESGSTASTGRVTRPLLAEPVRPSRTMLWTHAQPALVRGGTAARTAGPFLAMVVPT